MEIIWLWVGDNFPQFAWVLVLIFVVWAATKFYIATTAVIREVPLLQVSLTKIIQTNCYSESNSPRSVNLLGRKLLRESGAEKVIEQIKESFIAELEASGIDNPLELERACRQSLVENMNDERLNVLQTFIYNHPTFYGKPLTYLELLSAMSLVLRDEYLKRNPELITK